MSVSNDKLFEYLDEHVKREEFFVNYVTNNIFSLNTATLRYIDHQRRKEKELGI